MGGLPLARERAIRACAGGDVAPPLARGPGPCGHSRRGPRGPLATGVAAQGVAANLRERVAPVRSRRSHGILGPADGQGLAEGPGGFLGRVLAAGHQGEQELPAGCSGDDPVDRAVDLGPRRGGGAPELGGAAAGVPARAPGLRGAPASAVRRDPGHLVLAAGEGGARVRGAPGAPGREAARQAAPGRGHRVVAHGAERPAPRGLHGPRGGRPGAEAGGGPGGAGAPGGRGAGEPAPGARGAPRLRARRRGRAPRAGHPGAPHPRARQAPRGRMAHRGDRAPRLARRAAPARALPAAALEAGHGLRLWRIQDLLPGRRGGRPFRGHALREPGRHGPRMGGGGQALLAGLPSLPQDLLLRLRVRGARQPLRARVPAGRPAGALAGGALDDLAYTARGLAAPRPCRARTPRRACGAHGWGRARRGDDQRHPHGVLRPRGAHLLPLGREAPQAARFRRGDWPVPLRTAHGPLG
mmetsp:Transcript_56407/g.181098  ORF Transcript_56407/g.181098 Transcript_56407/m.181098 type:complete len:470 (+) Transcript_56407:216-1625(+)